MAFPPILIGAVCVAIGTGFIGVYDANGQCVIKLGTKHTRPGDGADIEPLDQHDHVQWRVGKWDNDHA